MVIDLHAMKDSCIWAFHNSSHFGITKTVLGRQPTFWWPTLRQDVISFPSEFVVCIERLKVNPHISNPIDKAKEPGETLYIDLMGPIVSSQDPVCPGNSKCSLQVLLVCVFETFL